jgi:hypothetical protein
MKQMYEAVTCNVGYTSDIEQRLYKKTSESIEELISYINEYIDEDSKYFDGEKITYKNFNIKQHHFHVDGTADVVLFEDYECAIYIRKL